MKANKIKLCNEKSCRNEATTEGFCRYHYIKNWKKLILEKKLSDEKADKFIAVLAEKVEPEVRDDYDGSTEVSENYEHALAEIGIKAKDIKKYDDGNPFASMDVDILLDNITYDETY